MEPSSSLLHHNTVTNVLLVCVLWKNPQVLYRHLGYEKQMCTELFFSLIQCSPGERTHLTISLQVVSLLEGLDRCFRSRTKIRVL